jgi:tetratricopeptide (TPR) repeat protein
MLPRGSRRTWLAAAALTLAVAAAYAPALRGGLLWDDDAHVTRPELQSWAGLGRIWFEVGATQQYYPVLHSAFWVEHRLWGDATLGYHLVNVLWHGAAACLFILVLRRLAVPGAWLAGLAFALHPVGVESVAWISEQKNTLSTVFYLLAALALLDFDATRRRRSYLLGLGLFVLALLTKSVTATLPAALLVVAWWRRGRLSWRSDVLPLAPLLALGIAAGALTAGVERRFIGAQGGGFDLGGVTRCCIAGRAVWFYLGKLLWPSHLTFIYPRWDPQAAAGWRCLYPAGVLVSLAALWALRRRTRAPLAAALLFVGTLFPALGFINVYPFVNSFVADHFQYLASLGLLALGAAALERDWGQAPQTARAARLAGGLILGILGILTWRQSRMYRDAATLYRETIARNPGCWLAHNNLGNILRAEGRADEAMAHYEEALRLKPDYADAHCNLGIAWSDRRRLPEAIAEYGRALALNPDFPEARFDLGLALESEGRLPEALQQYQEAARLAPGRPEVQNRLGNALSRLGRWEEAEPHYREALRLRPGYPEAHYDLGILLRATGLVEAAVAEYREALRLRPDYPDAHFYLGAALAESGRRDEAVAEYREALRLRPDDPEVRARLAEALRPAGR